MSDDPFQPLHDRGISEDVWTERGYIPYYGERHPKHDPEALRELLARYPLEDDQLETLMRFAANARDARPPCNTFLRFQGDPRVPPVLDGHDGHGQGLVMLKYAVSEDGQPLVFPQLRPEYEVRTGGTTWHRHDEDYTDNDVPDEERLRKHLEKRHGGNMDFPADRMHEHEDFAKYLLAPNAQEPYSHDHATAPLFQGEETGRRALIDHLRSRRSGHAIERDLERWPMEGLLQLVQGEHPTDPKRQWKIARTHRRDKPGQHVADRLDMHPWAWERLLDAERVYFAIEGTPKADAILSQIIATGAPASVFDVPSVTLWKAPELAEFAVSDYLLFAPPAPRRKLVVIVPDADWRSNAAVVKQALFCRQYLRKKGVIACIAAPRALDKQKSCKCDAPAIDSETQFCRQCGGYLKGVDDFLAAGGRLDDLYVLDREVPGDFEFALYATVDGHIRSSMSNMAAMLRVRDDTASVLGRLRDHLDHGWLSVRGGKFATERNEWTGLHEWKGKAREDWPVFEIREDLRWFERPAVPLYQYEPRPVVTWQEAFDEELWRIVSEDENRLLPVPNVGDITRVIQAAAPRIGVTEKTIRLQPWIQDYRDKILRPLFWLIRDAVPDASLRELELIVGMPKSTVAKMLNSERCAMPPYLVQHAEALRQLAPRVLAELRDR